MYVDWLDFPQIWEVKLRKYQVVEISIEIGFRLIKRAPKQSKLFWKRNRLPQQATCFSWIEMFKHNKSSFAGFVSR